MSEYVNCQHCINKECERYGGPYAYTFCEKYIPDVVKEITNADRIRAMSDEELAKFLCNFRSCDSSKHPCNGCIAESYCYTGHTGMIDWLCQPAEEDT